MTDDVTLGARALLAGGLLVVSVFLAGCDFAETGDTAILNAESPTPPTVRYEFQYTPADTTANGQIEAVSKATDTLNDALSPAFTRDNVVSAQVDSVSIERLSAPTFDYLTEAEVHLGTSADGPRIAAGEFQSSQKEASLNVTTKTVTSIVKQGPTKAFVRLDRAASSRIPNPDRVQVTVYFRLEVKGV